MSTHTAMPGDAPERDDHGPDTRQDPGTMRPVSAAMTVVLTRPAGQSTGLEAPLRAAGFEVVDFPLIRIAPAADPASLDAALSQLAGYALAVFVSPNAIDQTFARFTGVWPVDLPVAVIGPGSVLALARHGVASPSYRVIGPDGALEQAQAMEADPVSTSGASAPAGSSPGSHPGGAALADPAELGAGLRAMDNSATAPVVDPAASPVAAAASDLSPAQAQRAAAQRVSSDNLFADPPPVDPQTSAAAAAAAAPASSVSNAAVSTSTDAPVDPYLIRFDSEALLVALEREFGLASFAGRRVLLIRGDGGRELLADTLRDHQAQVDIATVYQRSVPSPDPRALTQVRRLLSGRPHVWVLSSSEGIRNLDTLAAIHLDERERLALHRAHVIAPHPRIAESARASGFGSITTSGAGDAAVIRAVCAYAATLAASSLATSSATDGPAANSGQASRSGDSPAVSPTPRGASPSMTDPNDLPPHAAVPPTRFSASGADRVVPAGNPRVRLVLTWIALVIALGAVAGGLALNHKIDRFERTTSEHQQSGDRTALAVQQQSSQAIAGVTQTDRRISQLEGKLADAQNQQQALQSMYQDLARNRAEWTLAEIGQMLSSASQQLQLTGNVQLALFALQSADSRLALSDSDGPQMLEVRKAIAQDIDKLKAAPTVDLPGLAIKLDDAISRVDTLPLAGEAPVANGATPASGTSAAPGSATSATPASASAAGASDAWAAQGASATDTTVAAGTSPASASTATGGSMARALARFDAWWSDFGSRLGHQLAGVIQVRRIDNADAMLVAPDQAQYLRANVKLRLLTARLSLLSRDEKTMDADLDAADTALARYFDPAAKSTQTVRDLVSQVRHTSTSVELPNLNTSLEAIHQYKSGG